MNYEFSYLVFSNVLTMFAIVFLMAPVKRAWN